MASSEFFGGAWDTNTTLPSRCDGGNSLLNMPRISSSDISNGVLNGVGFEPPSPMNVVSPNLKDELCILTAPDFSITSSTPFGSQFPGIAITGWSFPMISKSSLAFSLGPKLVMSPATRIASTLPARPKMDEIFEKSPCVSEMANSFTDVNIILHTPI